MEFIAHLIGSLVGLFILMNVYGIGTDPILTLGYFGSLPLILIWLIRRRIIRKRRGEPCHSKPFLVRLMGYHVVAPLLADKIHMIVPGGSFGLLIVAGVLFVLFLIAPVFRSLMRWFLGLNDDLGTSHGTAKWLSPQEIKSLSSGLIIGKYQGKFVRYPDDSHIITFASTGSGKGVGSIIPNLLDYTGSVICIDPKGENAAISARFRRESLGQEVHVLDPWELAGRGCSGFNPLDWLTADSPDLIEDAALLADGLVLDTGHEDSHWDEEAKALLAGLCLYVALEEKAEGAAHLIQVRNILNYGAADFKGLLQHMSGLASGEGKVAAAANRMLQKADKEFSSVVSTAQRHTHFLDSGRMTKTLTHSDFSLFDIKKKPMTVYLVLPADRISTHNRWLRLVVSMAMAAMARVPGRPKPPVLFLLDEFAALGKLDMVETAAGLMRGYGLKLWPILQDLPQLQAKYPKGWESFIGNAGAMQLFGVNDKQTAEYFSKKIGAETIRLHSKSSSGHGASESEHAGGRALIMPDEIIRMDKNHLLALFQGRQPAMLDKLRYYSDPAFKGMFDPNPYI